MKKEPVFRGSCTALITPFGAEGVDYVRLQRLLELQAENGTAAVVLAGTTGEAATLRPEEYASMAALARSCTEGRMKLILGIGGNDTAACLQKARFAASCGADAVLMTPPYYNKTTQEGLRRHFLTVAEGAAVPLILYNVPSRTAIGITAESYVALSEHPNINGVKEASGDVSLIARISAECGDALHIWSGNDDHTVAMMALGALGVVSVASNLLPGEIARLTQLCLDGDYASAARMQRGLQELFRLLFVETNPIPVKAAMELLGLDSGLLRLPLVSISDAHREQLHACMERIGLPV